MTASPSHTFRIGVSSAAATAVLGLCLAAGCAGSPDVVVRPQVPAGPLAVTLQGQVSIVAQTRFPPVSGLRFGGVSGLAAVAGGRELLGISDDRAGTRVYRFAVSGTGADFRVTPLEVIALSAVPASLGEIDPEGIVVLPNGNMVISSDGVGTPEPRIPPALVEFGRYGGFIRELPVRDRFKPNPRGPQVKGVRTNIGFESLTMAPDSGTIFTATEAAVVQDGELPTFERGSPARILEYRLDDNGYTPGREFVYMVEPTHTPPFPTRTAVNGLVELLALSDGELLALERSFVQEAGRTPPRDMNRIRLYRIALAGATDVSGHESLNEVAGFVPVTKTLVFDLSDMPDLSPELAPSLDNFEGISFAAPLPDGRPTLLFVSDDNFNPSQRTWFLQFAAGGPVK